jgi:exonuclease SbcC
MQIVKVALENIKSYRRAVIHLGQGTTAIRGHNGAGKSTLVEAVGFALFDFLPYSPASRFVREGEKLGKVVVTFVSAADERVYEVERRCATSGSGAWFVVDPELHGRVAEGKEDMLDFLRLHLGVQTTLPLPDLFDNAIAVQQGTFTADFLQTGAVRRKKFDALLQVEEYRAAADALRETATYLKDQLAERDQTIARLTAQTAEVPAWRAERAHLAATVVQLGETMAQLVEERAAVEVERAAAQARQAEVARLDSARERAHGAWQVALTQLQSARDEVTRASEAQAICRRTQADFARHRAAQDALAQAQADERAAAALRIDLARAQQTLAEKTAAIAAAEKRLAEAQHAAQERDRLAPLVQRQGELEERLKDAQLGQQQLTQTRKEAEQIRADLEAARKDAARAQEQIAQVVALEPLAAERDERRAVLDRLKQEQAAQGERRQRRHALAEQRARQQQRLTSAESALHAAEAQVSATRALLPEAADLPAHECEVAELATRLATTQASIAQAEQSLHASKGGMCPFLKEPCQNMARRGIASLADYFSTQILEQMEQLHAQEAEHATANAALTHLRELQAQVDRLPEYEAAATKARTAHADQRAELERLDAEIAVLAATTFDPDQHAAAIKEAERAMQESAEADRACAKLPTLRSQLTRAEESIARLSAREQQNAHAITLATERASGIDTYAAELRALGDPRRQNAQCEARAAQMAGIQAELAQHAAAHAAAQKQHTALEQRLAPYAGLAERIAALQAVMAATAAAHDDYLRHDAAARRLPEAQERAAQAQSQADAAEGAYAAARQAYEAVAAHFDAAALAALEDRLREMNSEFATQRERLQATRQRANALDAQLAEADERLRDLAAIQTERAETEATQSLLAYCRDTIKEAGPSVMRALLREISAQANRIFGEVMGDRTATLTWQDDYDIVLRAGAYERHFAQLSGGEQMSAALAVRLALLKTLTRATIAFFDEPTQNMDDARRTNLAGQIRRVSGFDQLVVISHDDTFEEGLDAVIWVRKEGGESAVESDPQAALPAPIIPFPSAISA